MPDAVLEGLSVQQREAAWLKLLSGGGDASLTLVADQDGDAVGFCSVTAPSRDDDASDRTCEVAAIYVEPDVWREGIGRALLNTALRQVRENGWNEATLWVFAENDAARAFYNRFGFAPDGTETRHERTGQTERIADHCLSSSRQSAGGGWSAHQTRCAARDQGVRDRDEIGWRDGRDSLPIGPETTAARSGGGPFYLDMAVEGLLAPDGLLEPVPIALEAHQRPAPT